MAAFFWHRVAHAVGMIAGPARVPARPIVFAAGRLRCPARGAEIMREA